MRLLVLLSWSEEKGDSEEEKERGRKLKGVELVLTNHAKCMAFIDNE